jgi:hypothetical protein
MKTNVEKDLNHFVSAVIKNLFNNNGELILEPTKVESNFIKYFYKFSVKNEFEIVLTFFLEKLKDSSPYSIGVFIKSIRMQDDFMLSDWLKYEGYKLEKDPFDFATYHEDKLDLQMEGVINFLREIFENKKLKEILEGSFWEETPFDWAGLR